MMGSQRLLCAFAHAVGPTGEAGNAVGASGVENFGQRYGRQDSGGLTGQYGCACVCKPQ